MTLFSIFFDLAIYAGALIFWTALFVVGWYVAWKRLEKEKWFRNSWLYQYYDYRQFVIQVVKNDTTISAIDRFEQAFDQKYSGPESYRYYDNVKDTLNKKRRELEAGKQV